MDQCSTLKTADIFPIRPSVAPIFQELKILKLLCLGQTVIPDPDVALQLFPVVTFGVGI